MGWPENTLHVFWKMLTGLHKIITIFMDELKKEQLAFSVFLPQSYGKILKFHLAVELQSFWKGQKCMWLMAQLADV